MLNIDKYSLHLLYFCTFRVPRIIFYQSYKLLFIHAHKQTFNIFYNKQAKIIKFVACKSLQV